MTLHEQELADNILDALNVFWPIRKYPSAQQALAQLAIIEGLRGELKRLNERCESISADREDLRDLLLQLIDAERCIVPTGKLCRTHVATIPCPHGVGQKLLGIEPSDEE